MLDVLENKFICKVEENKVILRQLITRYKRVEKFKKACKQRILRNGSSVYLETAIKMHDKELKALDNSKHLIRCNIWSHSKTICRLREVKRGNSKKPIDWILIKSVFGG